MTEQNNDSLIFTGKIVWFNPDLGFGFIEWNKEGKKQKDMFVHYSDLQKEGFKTINGGVEVQFKVGKNLRGEDKAVEVIQIK